MVLNHGALFYLAFKMHRQKKEAPENRSLVLIF